jgi:EAL domain-containing protein (putative c-di-GMP-specific phosphodiesterase class I)/DNA-binding NarL/FixJ family response regulator
MTLSIRSLLVIDDSAVQRAHAMHLCQALGVAQVYEAGGGAEALDILAMLVPPPDALIVDLEMPGMDGIELIQQLHERRIAIPLIVASSRELSLIQSVEAMARNLGLPVLAAIQKPLRIEVLAAALEGLSPAADPAAMELAAHEEAPTIHADELRRAITDGEIKVHYQPKVDMRTGIVRGVEALARWRPAHAAFVPPEQFIALAEREGLIHDLTVSVMHQAMAQAAEWNAHGLKLSLAINLSPTLLNQPSLVSKVMSMVKQHALEADQVVLELTETSLVDGLGAALGVLARLRLKGFGLSIDDYGTGFSSMQQLARIPFTELKIDRSFVHGAHDRKNLRVILKSALDMARQLELVTVAEGIETIEDWRLLQECGCNVGQGYLIGRPMPAPEIEQWVKQSRQRQGELRPLPGASS